MDKYTLKDKLNNRFCELIFGDIEVQPEIKEVVMQDYMKKIDNRCVVFFKDGNEITDSLVSDFIAHCIRYDEIYEFEISKRWQLLYSRIIREKADEYDRKVLNLVNDLEAGKIDKFSSDYELFLEIKNFFADNKKFIEDNGGTEFYKERTEEIYLDIDYLTGNIEKRNIRRPKFM